MAIAVVMTSERKRILVDAVWMVANAANLYYRQARDGVWVPSCDLFQYEAGRRPFA
jgi:hypothetical protein